MVLLSGVFSLSSMVDHFLVFGFLLKIFFYHVMQPMMGSMQALSTVIHKASANNFTGSAVLNLLQSQVKTS